MADIGYEDMTFLATEDGVEVTFLQNYRFTITRAELEKIGPFRVHHEYLDFDVPEKRAMTRMDMLVSGGLSALTNRLTGRRAVYVHAESGIPLIGNSAFGLVDRNTSIIEVKPVTGCNLNCVFCSVDEGKSGRWVTDFIVDHEYLTAEFRKLAESKGCDVEAHIGTQGEPLLYPKLAELIKGLAAVERTKRISIDTNGTLLTKENIDRLKAAGLSRIQLSINALDPVVADRLAGTVYNLAHVLEMAGYAATKMGLLIAPVWVPGMNDAEMPKIIELSKKLGAKIGIQNFLSYKHGRNPVQQMQWEDFYKRLAALEQAHGVKLVLSEADFGIEKTKRLPKPFRKGEYAEVVVVCDGRLPGEKICAASARIVTVPDCDRRGTIRVRIIRDKHNIFYGQMAR